MYRLMVFITAVLISLGFLTPTAGDCGQQAEPYKTCIDLATGHKYVPNQGGTYTEYSKKGKLLRNDVPGDLPLLSRSENIREITADTWILYEKNTESRLDHMILQASNAHPEGWRCKGILQHVKTLPDARDMGLAYTQKRESISYKGLKLVATGAAYYDIATGHRYIRNPDNTYAEYSKKGKLLRANVPNSLKLLTHGKYIYDISAADYILYEKKMAGKSLKKIHPATDAHPAGYSSESLFSAVN